MHRPPRSPPGSTALIAAAVALATGDLLGLLWGRGLAGRVPDAVTGLVQLGGGLLCLLASRMGPRGPAFAPRAARVGPALAVLVFVGLVSGVRAGVAAADSCAARLEHGSDVALAGILLDRLPADLHSGRLGGSPGPRPSVRLASVSLVSGGRRCALPEVRARVRRRAAPVEAGTGVVVRGVWRRYPSGSLRDPSGYGSVGSAALDSVLAWRAAGPRSAALRWRGRLGTRLEGRLSARTAPLAGALVLADRSTLDPRARHRFVDAGILHLLAISGLHVGLIGAGLGWLLSLRIRGPRRWPIAAALVSAYVLFIGAPPSAVRAALVFWGFALAAVSGRPRRVGDVAALAAVLALVTRPVTLADPGFQLSFAGFAGVVQGRRLASRWRPPGRLRGAATAVLVGLGAFVATAPIAAIHFERIVPASLPASLATTWIVALAVPAIALALLLPGPLAVPFASSADVLLRVLDLAASGFASLPLSWAAPPLPPAGWAVLALLGVWATRGGRRGRTRAAVAGAALVVGLVIVPAARARAAWGRALFCQLSVGQGDAAVLRTRGGRWLLFDSGPGAMGEDVDRGFRIDSRMGDAGGRVIVPFLRAHGATAIELLSLSHPHLDHFGGSGAVFDAFAVRRVLDPGVPEPSGAYLAFLDRVDAEGALWMAGGRGDRLALDGAMLEILWPPGDAPVDANEGSLAFRLQLNGFRYLNTGDAPREVEAAILGLGVDVRADVLKLGHHGSRTSTGLDWLRAVRPRIAVLSLGRANRYGHPHPETLSRLDSARVPRTWRTDRDGSLCIEIGDGGWRVVDP